MRKTKFKLAFTALVFTFSSVINLLPSHTQTAAAVDCNDGFYDSNEIVWYRPDGCESVCVGNSLGTISGSKDLPIETVEYLDNLGVRSKIEDNKSRYEYAAEQTGVSWQALAALHFREADLDPEKSIVNGNDLGDGVNEYSGQDISEDPNADAVMAANTFIEMSLGVYQIEADGLDERSPAETWGKAFLAYDVGRVYSEAGRDYTQSPYVSNGLDVAHLDMSWDIVADERSGVDSQKVGALTLLFYLDGVRSSMGCASGVVAGDIVKTGINLSLDRPADSKGVKISDAKPAFIEAFKKLNNNRVPSESNPCETADCGIFVSVVIRSSGVDPDFPRSGTDIQLNYMNNSNRYSEVTNGDLQPGDILVYNIGVRDQNNYSGHIMIYTGNNGAYTAVDASLCERVPSVRENSSVVWMQSQPNYSAWRING